MDELSSQRHIGIPGNSPEDFERTSALTALPHSSISSPQTSFGATQAPSSVSEEKTVITRQPPVAPDEFFRSLSHSELSRVLIGTQLDHYTIDAFIGGGGMGAVFRGRDTRLDRDVAIKVIPSASRDPEMLRRFRTEAQSAAKLDHPNIARAYFVGETEGWNYIVFEFIDGINLRDLVIRDGRLSVDDAVCITRQIAEALQHASSRDVVHRDIKPSNILITDDGQAKLVDMGLARTTALERSANEATASGVTLGTFDYISPEQAKNPRDADVRSDLYSLGCTLYFLLTGSPPFPEGTALQKLLMHGSQMPDDPRYIREDLSPSTVAILFKMMAKKPDDRYQQPVDLIGDLQILSEIEGLAKSSATGSLAVAPAMIDSQTRWKASLPWLTAFAVLIFSTLGLQSFDRWRADFSIDNPVLAANEPRQVQNPSPNHSPPSSTQLPRSNPIVEPRVVSTIPPSGSSLSPTRRGDRNGTIREGQAGLGNESSVIGGVRSSMQSSNRSEDIGGQRQAKGSPPISPASDGDNISSRIPTQSPWTNDSFDGQYLSDSLIAMNGNPLRNVILVDPTSQPDRIGDRSARVTSLSEALAVAESNLTVTEIQIAANRMVVGPLVLGRSDLSIRAAPGFRPVLVMDEEALAVVSGATSWIRVGGGLTAELHGLHFEAVISRPRKIDVRLIEVEPASRMKIHDCTFTVSDTRHISNVCILGTDYNSTSSRPIEFDEEAQGYASQLDPLQIELKNVIVRGECGFVRLPTAIRTEVVWSNGLLAISNTMFDLGGAEVRTRTPPTVRVDLNRVTVCCELGFAQVRLNELHSFPVCLSRESLQCAYWCPPGIALIDVEGIAKTSELVGLIDLRGSDNAYDENIRELVRIRDGLDTDESIEIGDPTLGTFQEKRSETRIRWAQALQTDQPMSLQTVAAFQQREGIIFMPGFNVRDLPVLTPISGGG